MDEVALRFACGWGEAFEQEVEQDVQGLWFRVVGRWMRCLGLSIHTSPIMQRVDKVFDDADDVFKEAILHTKGC